MNDLNECLVRLRRLRTLMEEDLQQFKSCCQGNFVEPYEATLDEELEELNKIVRTIEIRRNN